MLLEDLMDSAIWPEVKGATVDGGGPAWWASLNGGRLGIAPVMQPQRSWQSSCNVGMAAIGLLSLY